MEVINKIKSYNDPLQIGELLLDMTSLHPTRIRNKPLVIFTSLTIVFVNVLTVANFIFGSPDLKMFGRAVESFATVNLVLQSFLNWSPF